MDFPVFQRKLTLKQKRHIKADPDKKKQFKKYIGKYFLQVKKSKRMNASVYQKWIADPSQANKMNKYHCFRLWSLLDRQDNSMYFFQSIFAKLMAITAKKKKHRSELESQEKIDIRHQLLSTLYTISLHLIYAHNDIGHMSITWEKHFQKSVYDPLAQYLLKFVYQALINRKEQTVLI